MITLLVGTLLERDLTSVELLTQGGDALAAISVDGSVDEATRQALLGLPDIVSASIVQFRAE